MLTMFYECIRLYRSLFIGNNPFDKLPDEIPEKILSYLSLSDINKMAAVSKKYNQAISKNSFWENWCMENSLLFSFENIQEKLYLDVIKQIHHYPKELIN